MTLTDTCMNSLHLNKTWQTVMGWDVCSHTCNVGQITLVTKVHLGLCCIVRHCLVYMLYCIVLYCIVLFGVA